MNYSISTNDFCLFKLNLSWSSSSEQFRNSLFTFPDVLFFFYLFLRGYQHRLQSSVSLFPEPMTEIFGEPDLYIDRGSTINLTCVVLHSPEPPAYIFWNHNNAVRFHKGRYFKSNVFDPLMHILRAFAEVTCFSFIVFLKLKG